MANIKPKRVKTVEVIVNANKQHRGIVDLKTTGTDATGRTVGANGIAWRLA